MFHQLRLRLMSFRSYIPVWTIAPFIRLIMPLIVGIILQWYCQLSLSLIIIFSVCFIVAYLLFQLLPLSLKFKLHIIQGVFINLLLFCFGLVITWNKDIRHNMDWFGHHCKDSALLMVRIDEPLVEKNKSYKAEGFVEQVIQNDTAVEC